MYPILIKNATSAAKDIKIFAILKPVSNDAKIKIAEGGVICLINDLAQISESLYYIPVWALQ